MKKTSILIRLIKNTILLFILPFIFISCNKHYGFEIENDSDYDLSIVFVGKHFTDSVSRLVGAYVFNEQFNFYSHKRHESINDSLNLLYKEFQDYKTYEEKLNYLIDSGYIFSFAEGILPTKSIEYWGDPELLKLQRDGINILYDDMFIAYYKNKKREYFNDMIIHNWFEIPLFQNSILIQNCPKCEKFDFFIGYFPGVEEIRIMYNNKLIKAITLDEFFKLKSKSRYFKGYDYSELKIRNKDIEEVIKKN